MGYIQESQIIIFGNFLREFFQQKNCSQSHLIRSRKIMRNIKEHGNNLIADSEKVTN